MSSSQFYQSNNMAKHPTPNSDQPFYLFEYSRLVSSNSTIKSNIRARSNHTPKNTCSLASPKPGFNPIWTPNLPLKATQYFDVILLGARNQAEEDLQEVLPFTSGMILPALVRSLPPTLPAQFKPCAYTPKQKILLLQ